MGEKKSFLMYKDWAKMIAKLSDQDAGRLLKSLYAYIIDGIIPDNLEPAADMAFTFMQQAFERDADKYEETCEKRRAAINKRWQEYKSIQENTKEYKSIQAITNDTDNDNDIDNDNDTDNDNDNDTDIYIREKKPENKSVKRFVPPTVDEVAAYCAERQNGIDAEQFVDHYTSNGWQVGKSKMKDWKAAVRTWERNRTRLSQQTVKRGRNDWIDDVEL